MQFKRSGKWAWISVKGKPVLHFDHEYGALAYFRYEESRKYVDDKVVLNWMEEQRRIFNLTRRMTK